MFRLFKQLIFVAVLVTMMNVPTSSLTAAPATFHPLNTGDTWDVPQGWGCSADVMIKNDDGSITNSHELGTGSFIITFHKPTTVVAPWGGTCSNMPPAEMAKKFDKSGYFLYFAETGHSLRGHFLSYWTDNGGLRQQGFPRTEEFQDVSTDGKQYVTQYFQRAVFEFHPENSAPNDVLLRLVGDVLLAQKGNSVTPSPTAPVANTAGPCNNKPIKDNWTFTMAECKTSVIVVGDIKYGDKKMWEGRKNDNDVTITVISKEGVTIFAEWSARVYDNTPENLQMIKDSAQRENREIHRADDIN